jgi:hypothetical protein
MPLAHDALRGFAKQRIVKADPRNAVIVAEGDDTESFYIIERARARSRHGVNERRRRLAASACATSFIRPQYAQLTFRIGVVPLGAPDAVARVNVAPHSRQASGCPPAIETSAGGV